MKIGNINPLFCNNDSGNFKTDFNLKFQNKENERQLNPLHIIVFSGIE